MHEVLGSGFQILSFRKAKQFYLVKSVKTESPDTGSNPFRREHRLIRFERPDGRKKAFLVHGFVLRKSYQLFFNLSLSCFGE